MGRNEVKGGRLADFVQRSVATALERDLKDPALRGVTITEARVTPDFHIAFVFWISQNRQEAARALEKAKGKLRSRVAKGCGLRTAPSLEFRYDELQDNAIRIEKKIDEALKKDEEMEKESSEKGFAGEENPYR
ncbi:MAG: 30S ribosome-binding factor RbfA [Aeriscardovia sp.]|nr:30S ribosome-binding factor RbfA [Aeriscardovia sp.]